MIILVVFGAPALAICERIAIKPIAEALLRQRDISAARANVFDPRVEALESEVSRLRTEVQRLLESAHLLSSAHAE